MKNLKNRPVYRMKMNLNLNRCKKKIVNSIKKFNPNIQPKNRMLVISLSKLPLISRILKMTIEIIIVLKIMKTNKIRFTINIWRIVKKMNQRKEKLNNLLNCTISNKMKVKKIMEKIILMNKITKCTILIIINSLLNSNKLQF